MAATVDLVDWFSEIASFAATSGESTGNTPFGEATNLGITQNLLACCLRQNSYSDDLRGFYVIEVHNENYFVLNEVLLDRKMNISD